MSSPQSMDGVKHQRHELCVSSTTAAGRRRRRRRRRQVRRGSDIVAFHLRSRRGVPPTAPTNIVALLLLLLPARARRGAAVEPGDSFEVGSLGRAQLLRETLLVALQTAAVVVVVVVDLLLSSGTSHQRTTGMRMVFNGCFARTTLMTTDFMQLFRRFFPTLHSSGFFAARRHRWRRRRHRSARRRRRRYHSTLQLFLSVSLRGGMCGMCVLAPRGAFVFCFR